MKRHTTVRSLAVALTCASIGTTAGCKEPQSSAPAPAQAPAVLEAGPAHAATAPTPAATTDAAPAAAEAPPPSASPPDPRDAPLGAYLRGISQAVLHAAKGEPVDPHWVAHNAASSVATISPEAHAALGVLGTQLNIVLVEMEIDEVAQPGPGEHHHVMAHAIMLPDGSIRWGTVSGRHDESALVQPTPGLEHSAPQLVTASTRVVDALRGGCNLPWLAPSDVAALPASIRAEFVADMNSTHAACTQVQGVHGDWRPHVDDVRVLVQGNGHYGFLNTVFDVEGADTPASRLVLSPLHVEVVPEAH